MNDIATPLEIKISDIVKARHSLSPSNYNIIAIPRKLQTKLGNLLDPVKPYIKGDEPGRGFYVHRPGIHFVRNSCISQENYAHSLEKEIFLKPSFVTHKGLTDNDILLCKDANVGDACMYIEQRKSVTLFSSGIVRLNFLEDKLKYYCLAFFKDEYFRRQLDALTPRGATIRHAGDRFLECSIPELRSSEEWVFGLFEALVKNIAYSELVCQEKMNKSFELIGQELPILNTPYENPVIQDLFNEGRMDAGIYTKQVNDFFESIKLYRSGFSTLEDLGFRIKRGPNLAKRDLGRSIQVEEFRPGYHLLVYPSDIADAGYLLRASYLGARNPVWFLGSGNILFAAEGTVGKTFVICDESLSFTTNFHGAIIYPIDTINMQNSVFVGLFLQYMKYKGIMDKLAVGGQGGSFAVGYWHKIVFPKISNDKLALLEGIYNSNVALDPSQFDLDKLRSSGIFQLNNFRILCNGILRKIINDIKTDRLSHKDKYITDK